MIQAHTCTFPFVLECYIYFIHNVLQYIIIKASKNSQPHMPIMMLSIRVAYSDSHIIITAFMPAASHVIRWCILRESYFTVSVKLCHTDTAYAQPLHSAVTVTCSLSGLERAIKMCEKYVKGFSVMHRAQ